MPYLSERHLLEDIGPHKVRAVLLNSGGLDSRLTAHIAVGLGYELYSLFVDNNPRGSAYANLCAERTADLYCADHFVLPFPVDWMVIKERGNLGLPFTNAQVHLFGAQYAIYRGLDEVFTGVRTDMAHDDWMSQLMAFVNGMKRNEAVLFNAPLWPMRTPDDTFAKARELGVPIDMTAVCKLDLACGECFHCRDRERLLHA